MMACCSLCAHGSTMKLIVDFRTVTLSVTLPHRIVMVLLFISSFNVCKGEVKTGLKGAMPGIWNRVFHGINASSPWRSGEHRVG